MKAYEKELLSYNSNIEITKDQYLSDERSYEQRTRNGQQQAKKDIKSGYDDGLSRYRLRCAHTLRDTNPFASSYMNEYNKERGYGIETPDLIKRHQEQMLRKHDGYDTYKYLREKREKEYQEWLLEKQKEEEEKEKQLCQKNQEN